MKISLDARRKALFVAIAAAVVAIIAVINFTETMYLQAVTLDGEPIENWSEQFPLQSEKALLRQPLDSLTKLLLARDGIVKVNLNYDFPDRIDIHTNLFEPVCFVVDASSGRIKGVNELGRIVPLREDESSWDCPILTSVTANNLYGFCGDSRVEVLVAELLKLKNANNDLFRLISEIDLDSNEYIVASIDGFDYRLKLNADEFFSQMKRFVEFIGQFDTDLSTVRSLDLTNYNMIVSTENK